MLVMIALKENEIPLLGGQNQPQILLIYKELLINWHQETEGFTQKKHDMSTIYQGTNPCMRTGQTHTCSNT